MLGNFLKQLFSFVPRKKERATPVARDGVQEVPDDWSSRILRLQKEGRHQEIVAMCDRVLARRQDNLTALSFIASAWLAQGELQASIKYLRQITRLVPGSAEAWINLANVLAAAADVGGVIDSYHHAIGLLSDPADTWNELALILKSFDRLDEAEASCRSGLKSNSRHIPLHHTVATVLFEQGRVNEAIVEMRTVLSLNPELPAVHSDLLRMLTYSDAHDVTSRYEEHRKWSALHERPRETISAHRNSPDPMRRLRIGYVSSCFRKHPAIYFFESIVEHHDTKGFEIFLYSNTRQPDHYSGRLRTYGAVWRDIADLNDEELADAIRIDGIDILVELDGHTTNSRLLAFARRPAPIQVNWLGFPSTTGMDSIDYRVTDAYCDPPGKTEHLNSERLLRLPTVYIAWRPPEDAPDIGSLPAIRAQHITFGSFNACHKITPTVIALWSEILRRVPTSRLMFLTINGKAAKRRIRDGFSSHDIDTDRLDFLPELKFEDYLIAHQKADIALDTFPYHGIATTCFALWMGLPTVVLISDTHASRVGGSMLSTLGLPQLIAETSDQYVQIATSLATDIAGLVDIRAGLRDRMLRSPNTDSCRCARDLENMFREIWKKWCEHQDHKPRG